MNLSLTDRLGPIRAFLSVAVFTGTSLSANGEPKYVLVDTSQNLCYDTLEPIRPPKSGRSLYGQDAQYQGVEPSYQDNGDGTVTDLNTGLMWSKRTPAQKYTLAEAESLVRHLNLAGHDDWRIPTVKELYSLIDFRGVTGMIESRSSAGHPDNAIPFINTDYFGFRYGDTQSGERFIDAQWLSSTLNVSPVMNRLQGLFGVNFADGRIKCYPIQDPRRGEKRFFLRVVRGNPEYGINQFRDNGDGTITDHATGLIWTKLDSGRGMDWEDALSYAENLRLGGASDWRLPNAKELHSVIDYTRSPDATNSPAIDPMFQLSTITNEAGQTDYPYLWTSTTHVDGPNASQAVYFALGRALGQMHGRIMDVHGAGAQRSDPKFGEAQLGHGPQGDAQRIDNYVLCVRGGLNDRPNYSRTDSTSYPQMVQLEDGSYRPTEMTYTEHSPQRTHDPREGKRGDHPPHPGHNESGRPPPRHGHGGSLF